MPAGRTEPFCHLGGVALGFGFGILLAAPLDRLALPLVVLGLLLHVLAVVDESRADPKGPRLPSARTLLYWVAWIALAAAAWRAGA